MTVFLYFLTYLLACLGVAVFAAPILHPWLFQPLGLAPESSLYRLAMLLALLGLPFFLRLLGLNSWRAAGFGLPRREAWAALGKGLLIGIAIMAALTTALWLLDIRHFGPPADKWGLAYLLRTLLGGLVAGLAVGLIEETFFRGLLHTGMRRSCLLYTSDAADDWLVVVVEVGAG